MKKILIIVGAVVVALLIAGGSFYGGMAYQNRQIAQTRANFFRQRGQGGAGQFPNDSQPGGGFGVFGYGNRGANGQGGTGGFARGGTVGQVKSLNGNTLQVSTAQNVTTVNLSNTTRIEKYQAAQTSELQPGVQVLVTGERDANGNINATQILIMNSNPAARINPSATGTAP